MEKKSNIVRVTESAMMIAMATLLSMAKLMARPYVGSVTMASLVSTEGGIGSLGPRGEMAARMVSPAAAGRSLFFFKGVF